jgi:hypothetical protein
LTEANPRLVENFLNVLGDHAAGDPMRADVQWTNLSRRQIARRLKELGTPAGKNVVSRLLWEHGYRRRKPQKKRTMGQHADRNAQFERIAELKQKYLAAGEPVISIDTKKKELLGNFHRDGVTDGVEPTVVNDHDFPSYADGKLIPHGIYDLAKNEASLHLNDSHDTTELACESIALWWHEQGRLDYPRAEELLVLCDGGGSNSSSKYLFKEDLQALSNRLGLKIRIAHYPPYCSKYNPIEHRVFPHVTRACQGVPLETIETAKHYMEKTETTKGLNVVVRIIAQAFQAGRKYAANFKKNMTIQFDDHLPNWNYTAIPDTT